MLNHLTDIVEVPVRCSLLSQELLVSIEHDVQVELLLQQHQAVVAETLDGSHGCNLAYPAVSNISIHRTPFFTHCLMQQIRESSHRSVRHIHTQVVTHDQLNGEDDAHAGSKAVVLTSVWQVT